MVWLSVDAGTSLVKTVAFDDDGAEVGLSRREVPIERPQPGFSEQDPEAVWDAVADTVREVGEAVDEPVRLLAVTGQGDGCWFVDEDGEPHGSGILWNDARGRPIIEEWRRSGLLDETFRVNGSVPFPGAQCGILPWLREHDPDRLERVGTVAYAIDLVRARLTGQVFTDESNASVPFFDIRARAYSDEVLRAYGLEWAHPLLPEVRRPEQEVLTLQASAAERLGLPEGVPVSVGPFDIAATAIGIGAVEDGQATSILGTTLCNEVVVDTVDTDGDPSGLHVCQSVPGTWLRAFASMSGTDSVSWLQDALGLDDPAALSTMGTEVGPGADGLVVLPYLSPAGERAPFLDPAARGTVLGLSLEHTRAHLARAFLEGLTFVIADCLSRSATRPTELRVSGGGAASDFWCQLIADVTDLPVRRYEGEEFGARGALMAGLVASGEFDGFGEAVERFVRPRDGFEPDAGRRDRYTPLFEQFLALRETAAQSWSRLAGRE